ncbi:MULTISPECIES: MarR family winged helix-turn-helix transcriptional regulator [Oerskovia]|uniref:MarR family transcriptional regulator n=2 Tax=Oerskovia TaxID=162491 RepID=A0ABR8V3F0_9CELL|nr:MULTISPECIES: MarR family transcriptional regulator [Oerskovia]MBD7999304.1 MarR family transcriptional regulator [Oerskovia gallyi]MBM7498453.1 DNA-binding MarR family transcriptional regulator [Oerskovia paurometabola]
MTSDPPGDRARLQRELIDAQHTLQELVLARRLEPLMRTRLTAQQMRALGILLIDGERSTAHLGDVLGVSPATISGIVDRLEAAGMASRRPDPEDGRVRLVAATERGAEAVRSIVASDAPAGPETLERLTLDELEGLRLGLAGLLRVVRESGDEVEGSTSTGGGPAAAASGEA